MEEQSSSLPDAQQAERENSCASGLLSSFLYVFSGSPAYRVVLSTFRPGLLPSVNPLEASSQTHPRVWFPNLLGFPQSSQIHNQD
jgi:hypothetical protein